jgi:hypothetical protein
VRFISAGITLIERHNEKEKDAGMKPMLLRKGNDTGAIVRLMEKSYVKKGGRDEINLGSVKNGNVRRETATGGL